METNNTELLISSYASEIGKSEESVAISKNNDKDITISLEITNLDELEESLEILYKNGFIKNGTYY